MKTVSIVLMISISLVLIIIASSCGWFRDPNYSITLVDMIPENMSAEDRHDGEPNIAVHPNGRIIAASSLTKSSWCINNTCPPPCPDFLPGQIRNEIPAPIFISSDRGLTWQEKGILPSYSGKTHDISLAFSNTGYLYASFLQGCFSANDFTKGFMTRKSTNVVDDRWVTSATISSMLEIDNRTWAERGAPGSVDRSRYRFDQPWINAITVGGIEHVAIGVNRVSETRCNMGNGMTARVLVSNDNNPFIGRQVERIGTAERNLSAIRTSSHTHGEIYAVFYHWKSGGLTCRAGSGMTLPEVTPPICDVVVVKDIEFGGGEFRSLSSSGRTGGNGVTVAADVEVPICYPVYENWGINNGGRLGNIRLVGSNLSISVDPRNQNHVVVAYCANDNDGVYTLFFNESWTGGESWENIHRIFPVPNAINPAVSISNNGQLGILYQNLSNNHWQTHFFIYKLQSPQSHIYVVERAYQLSDFNADQIIRSETELLQFSPLGDYVDLQTVGNTFFGVFSTWNSPGHDRFPAVAPRYQRYHNESGFTTAAGGDRLVAASVDPFFFKVEPR